MRYLRILTNAVIGGVLVATFLVVLVLQINPQVPTASSTSLHWWGSLLMFYGLYATVALYLAVLIVDVFSVQPVRPAWLSVRLLAWIAALCSASAAAVTWANLAGFQAMLGGTAAVRMRQGAGATT